MSPLILTSSHCNPFSTPFEVVSLALAVYSRELIVDSNEMHVEVLNTPKHQGLYLDSTYLVIAILLTRSRKLHLELDMISSIGP